MITVLPEKGQCWRHWKGDLYTILAVGRMEADLTPVVTYANEDGCWVRPLSEFLDIVDGREPAPRFALEYGADAE